MFDDITNPPQDAEADALTTQDLADRFQRAAEQAEADRRRKADIKRLQDQLETWKPGKDYIKALTVTGAATVASWLLLAVAVASADGTRVGWPIALPLALAATLSICTTGVAIAGWLDRRAHARDAARDAMWLYREDDRDARFEAILDRVTGERLMEAHNAGWWAGSAQALRDIHGADSKVTNIRQPRGPGRNEVRSPASR